MTLLMRLVIVIVGVVVAVMQGPSRGTAVVVEHGLRLLLNVARKNDDNRRLLGDAGACEGK